MGETGDRIEKLQQSREIYKKLFDSLTDAAYITTPDGKIVDINPAGLKLFGFEKEEFLQLDVPDLYVTPEVRKKAMEILEEQEYLKKFEYNLYRKDGSEFTVREDCIAVKDKEGKVVAYYGVLKDITHQKELEEKLSAIYDLSREITLTRDLDKISEYVVKAADEVLNFDYIDLFLLDEDTEELHLVASRGWEERKIYERIPVNNKKGITAYVARTGESLNVPDVRKDERYLLSTEEAQSELSVPLKAEGKVIGVIDAESEKLNAFSEEDQQLLETLSSQAAVAIENARHFEELESLKEFHETIVNSLNEGIWVENEDGYCTYINPKGAEMLGYTQGEIIGKHWREIIAKEEQDHVAKESGTRREGRSSSYETILLTEVGKKIPVIVSVTPLFDKGKFMGTVAATTDVRQQKEMENKLSVIHNLSKEMSLSLNVDNITSIVLDTAEKVLNFGNIDLFLVKEEKEELYLKECRGLKEPEMDTTIPVCGEKGITAYVARTGESLNVPDVRKDERYIFGLKNSRSELCVPLRVRNHILGVIDAESTEINAFSKKDEELLETLASQAAVAIENARLVKRIKKASELRQLFISILCHDLKNPLTAIKGYAELMEKDLHGENEKYMGKMKKSMDKIFEIIKRADLYSKLQERSYEGNFEEKDLGDIIGTVVKELMKKVQNKSIALHYTRKKCPIDATPMLSHVFLNLIDNAIKYSPEESKIEISIGDNDDSWRVQVKDRGEGISDDAKEAIFERFERKNVDVKGTGLGLAIVKQIVEIHDGDVWVEDNPEGGSIFVVELPKERK